MKILVINCGSSSLKYELFDMRTNKSITKGKIERIAKYADYIKSVQIVKTRLLDPAFKYLSSVNELIGIGHRVVHGGEEFKEATLITPSVIKSIEKYIELAPLHNPPSLAGIKACMQTFAGIPQVAVFDTSFHATMPDYAYVYGIPYDFYKTYGVRRYGFHGTSHRFVSNKAAEILKKPLKRLKLVTAHLGNGCSMAAVKNGKVIDTTMGFTPLEGLLMGTRSGDIDPAIIIYIMEKMRINTKKMNDILNKQSGLLGVSGSSNDMRDILIEMRKNSERAKLAFNIFVYKILKYIGSYAAAMGGLDAIIFTAGIGEKTPLVRKEIAKALNGVFGKKVKLLVVPTNEELLIAMDTFKLVANKQK